MQIANSPFRHMDGKNLTSAFFLFATGIFYPFQSTSSRLMTFGMACSYLSVSFNPLRGRINRAAEIHLIRFQVALFSLAVSLVAAAYATAGSEEKIQKQKKTTLLIA